MIFIYIDISAESHENYIEVDYKTIDDVKFIHSSHNNGEEIFHFFKPAESPFIIKSKLIFNTYIHTHLHTYIHIYIYIYIYI